MAVARPPPKVAGWASKCMRPVGCRPGRYWPGPAAPAPSQRPGLVRPVVGLRPVSLLAAWVRGAAALSLIHI